MIKTRLFEFILERANEVKCEFGSETLYASHVAVAVADFVKEKYFGLSDWEGGCPRFEEERLRYLFSKVVKLSSYFRHKTPQAGIRSAGSLLCVSIYSWQRQAS